METKDSHFPSSSTEYRLSGQHHQDMAHAFILPPEVFRDFIIERSNYFGTSKGMSSANTVHPGRACEVVPVLPKG